MTSKDIAMLEFDTLFPPMADESQLLVGCSRGDFSASAIARAVEDCDAQVLNLNVTSIAPPTVGGLVVALRVNHRNTESIARSLARYGYDVIYAWSGSAADDDRMRSRANEVLRYINV